MPYYTVLTFNIVCLITSIVLCVEEGPYYKDEEVMLFFLFITTPLITTVLLMFYMKPLKLLDMWPFIMFKRLALEEKKKLEKLEKE